MLIIERGSKKGSGGYGAAAVVDADNNNAGSGIDDIYDIAHELNKCWCIYCCFFYINVDFVTYILTLLTKYTSLFIIVYNIQILRRHHSYGTGWG